MVSHVFRLDIRKRLFPQRVARHWNSRGSGHSPKPDRVQGTFGQHFQTSGGIVGVVFLLQGQWVLVGPSQLRVLCDSVCLWTHVRYVSVCLLEMGIQPLCQGTWGYGAVTASLVSSCQHGNPVLVCLNTGVMPGLHRANLCVWDVFVLMLPLPAQRAMFSIGG